MCAARIAFIGDNINLTLNFHFVLLSVHMGPTAIGFPIFKSHTAP